MVDLANKQVFILVGFPGSGKSTLAKKIAKKFKAKHLSSDTYRKQISNQTRYDPVGNIQSNKQRMRAYNLMYNEATKLVQNGMQVVLDATHIEEEKRKRVVNKLTQTIPKSVICYITIKTPYKVIKNRMAKFKDINNESSVGETDESFYDGWKRVYNHYVKEKDKGLVSWPNKNENIEIIEHEQLKTLLD